MANWKYRLETHGKTLRELINRERIIVRSIKTLCKTRKGYNGI